GAGDLINQIGVLRGTGLHTDDKLYGEAAVAPFGAALDLEPVLLSGAGEEAGTEIVLPGSSERHEIVTSAASQIVDSVDRQLADHSGVELVQRRRCRERDTAGLGVLTSGH